MKAVGYSVAVVVFIIVNSILSGYTLSVLWDWFVVNQLSVESIDIPTAIGFALIITFLTHQEVKSEDDSREFSDRLIEAITKGLLKPVFVLLIGWVVTMFL